MTRRKPQNPHLPSALRTLRARAGLSLTEIAATVGVSQQAMSRWEKGDANIPEDKLPLYLSAIKSDSHDLSRVLMMVEEGPTPAFQAYRPQPIQDKPLQDKAWHSIFPETLTAFIMNDESMAPWCGVGETVWYEPGRPPRQYDECLIEFYDGTRLVRQYFKESDGQTIFYRVNPDATESYVSAAIKAKHRIVLRGN